MPIQSLTIETSQEISGSLPVTASQDCIYTSNETADQTATDNHNQTISNELQLFDYLVHMHSKTPVIIDQDINEDL